MLTKWMSVIVICFLALTAVASDYAIVPMGGDNPYPYTKPAPLPWKQINGRYTAIRPDGKMYEFNIVKKVTDARATYLLNVKLLNVDGSKLIAQGAGTIRYNILTAQIIEDDKMIEMEMRAFYTNSNSSNVEIFLRVRNQDTSKEDMFHLINREVHRVHSR